MAAACAQSFPCWWGCTDCQFTQIGLRQHLRQVKVLQFAKFKFKIDRLERGRESKEFAKGECAIMSIIKPIVCLLNDNNDNNNNKSAPRVGHHNLFVCQVCLLTD